MNIFLFIFMIVAIVLCFGASIFWFVISYKEREPFYSVLGVIDLFLTCLAICITVHYYNSHQDIECKISDRETPVLKQDYTRTDTIMVVGSLANTDSLMMVGAKETTYWVKVNK